MEKKIIKRTKIEEIPVYVAFDGTEFDTEERCRAYENDKSKDDVQSVIDNIERCNASTVIGYSDSESVGITWFRPHNANEINALNTFFKSQSEWHQDLNLSTEDVNKWVGIEYLDDYTPVSVHSFDEELNAAKAFLKEFGIGKKSESETVILADRTAYMLPLEGGHLDIRASGEIDYPGVDIEFIPDVPSEDHLSNPRVLFEKPNNEELRVLIWNNPYSEDYSKKIYFNEEEDS